MIVYHKRWISTIPVIWKKNIFLPLAIDKVEIVERYFVDQKDYFQNNVIIELIVLLGHLEIPFLSPIYQKSFEI